MTRIVVMGDSNTNGFVGTLPQGIDQGMAYVDYVVGDPLTFAGGWGTDGATSTVMAANTPTVEDVDVALIMIGTNNRIAGVPDTQLDADILQTVEKLAPKETVILGIPPQNASPETPPEVNAHLEQFADAQGYHFFNPWVNLTNKDMKWRTEFFRDGIHTNMTGYKLMGARCASSCAPRSSTRAPRSRGNPPPSARSPAVRVEAVPRERRARTRGEPA
ncbi:hypothetical protein BC477_01075 [Clavibacter michiganensis subsp. michiganensis]|nr:hypothetical protein BC477_01075 [Clavibacter michiganensis subsp. michiganensis]